MKESARRTMALLLAAMFLLLAGCGGKSNEGPNSNLSKPAGTNGIEPEQTMSPDEEGRKDAFANSTAENDTDMGLKSVKIDTAERNLTDEQKLVISYFDSDYFEYSDYEFMRRYPQVFDRTQVSVHGTVVKTLSQSADAYSLILQLDSWDENAKEYVVMNGKPKGAMLIEGDVGRVNGRYNGVETIEVDGISYTVPVISVFQAYFGNQPKFDTTDIKKIARVIFGDDVEVRYPARGIEIDEDFSDGVYKTIYLAELEDQSNAKFSKYYLYINGGSIDVATAPYGYQFFESDIERHVEFSADFKHFFLFTYDWSMETMTLEYYDQQFNKIWKREFEEIVPPETEGTMARIYDYTKNNVYCLANNELYIINIETGEDTYPPAFVGDKIGVRKLDDGILLISHNKSDGIMKVSLDGKLIWKTNLVGDVINDNCVQIVGDTIVLELDLWIKDAYNLGSEIHYIVLNKDDGSVIVDAVHQ